MLLRVLLFRRPTKPLSVLAEEHARAVSEAEVRNSGRDRANRIVLVIHKDGSLYCFHGAFLEKWRGHRIVYSAGGHHAAICTSVVGS